jgi:hypothetical protein
MIWLRLLWIRLFDAHWWTFLTYEAEKQNTTRRRILKAELEAEKWLRENPVTEDELEFLVKHCKSSRHFENKVF